MRAFLTCSSLLLTSHRPQPKIELILKKKTPRTGKTALDAFHRPGAGRGDADHPLHAPHHALLARTLCLAGQTQDPHGGLRAARHPHARRRTNNDRVRVGRQTTGPPRHGRDDPFGRRALDNRASVRVFSKKKSGGNIEVFSSFSFYCHY